MRVGRPTWHSARVTLDRDGGSYRARTQVDDVIVRDVRELGIPDGARIQVLAGAFTTNQSGGTAELWIDDVGVRVR